MTLINVLALLFFSSLQAPSTHSVMTRFQLTPRSSSFSRSLVDSSCPNHRTPCWETAERFKHAHSPSVSVSISQTHTHARIHTYTLTRTHQMFQACFQQKYFQPRKQMQFILLSPPLHQIIDPFVEVEIIGLPVDCCKEQTRVVDDNG